MHIALLKPTGLIEMGIFDCNVTSRPGDFWIKVYPLETSTIHRSACVYLTLSVVIHNMMREILALETMHKVTLPT